jgi:hypothetical protein
MNLELSKLMPLLLLQGHSGNTEPTLHLVARQTRVALERGCGTHMLQMRESPSDS